MFHFHSLLIYFSIYIVTSKGFSQFCNSHAYSILVLVQCFMQFQACCLYILSMLIRFIFNSATSSPFQVCLSSVISLYNTFLSFTHPNFSAILSLAQSYATPSFSQLCSLFFTYVLYFSIQVWLLSHTLVLKFSTLTSSTSSKSSVSFLR